MAQSELINFIIDLEDDDCPETDLHIAAFQGQVNELETLLCESYASERINHRVRPYLSSPLRLAATGM